MGRKFINIRPSLNILLKVQIFPVDPGVYTLYPKIVGTFKVEVTEEK